MATGSFGGNTLGTSMYDKLQNAMNALTAASNEILQAMHSVDEETDRNVVPQLQRMNDEVRMLQTRIASFMARGARKPPSP